MAGEARSVSRPVLAGALAAIGLAAAFIAPWEGRELAPYRDVVGVWTVCEGITQGVEQRRYTNAECDALLRDNVARHLRDIAACIHRPLTEHQWVAVGSWTYNVGSASACRSSLVAKINAGASPADWCRELLKWNRAGGKVLRGLTRRREAEYRECVK